MGRIFIALLLSVSIAHANEKKTLKMTHAPSGSMGSATEAGQISMRCTGEAPYDILECQFVQASVWHPDRTFDEKAKAEFLKISEKELNAKFKSCKDADSKIAKARAENAKLPEPQRLYREREIEFGLEICSCVESKSLEERRNCLVSKFEKQDENKSKTHCSVMTNDFRLTFKRAGPRKWINNDGAKGLCDVVNVSIIEHEPDSTSLWTYTQTRLSADTDSDLCKHLDINKPVSYSWKNLGDSVLKCDSIGFR